MIIDCISDLHGFYPKLKGGDLLIVAGDFTAKDSAKCWINFEKWIRKTDYREKIIIAGNHDSFLSSREIHDIRKYWNDVGITYLCDSGVKMFYYDDSPKKYNESFIDIEDLFPPKIKSLKIWGSPWTKWFPEVNPESIAFMLKTEEELAKKWELIPDDVDILVTHGPPYTMLDRTIDGDYAGSKTLSDRILELKKIKLHVFGHIHENYGECHQGYRSKHPFDEDLKPIGHLSVNASYVNEKYKPVNKPIRVIL
jgi:Icc-related predicted phosphoesterase